MVARGRALMREWGASVQCREVGEQVRYGPVGEVFLGW